MRPLSTPRWSQLRRPVATPTILSHRVRNFHATQPAPFVAEAVTVAIDSLHGLHTLTGLPWAASIPLAAFIVRMVIAGPLVIMSRVNIRQKHEVSPLIVCMKKHYEDAIRAKHLEDRLHMRDRAAEKQMAQEMHKRAIAVYKEWNIPTYPQYLPLLQIPIWLSLMEGIRNMCGVNMGLLRYFVPASNGNGGHAVNLPGMEPSLANEGALWFPDLLAGDSTYILPLILSLSIIANVRTGFKTMSFAEASDHSIFRMATMVSAVTMKQLLTVGALWIGYTASVTGMPAGMMLYWIASTNTATLQAWFLDKFLFASKPLSGLQGMHVRVLKPGEKKPPVKSMLE